MTEPIGVAPDPANLEGDNTPENESDPLAGIPNEDETFNEIGEEKDKKTPEVKDKKPDRSEIAQKIRYREKLQESNKRIDELQDELGKLKTAMKTPTDEAEKRAQDYIRNQAREVYQELLKEQKKEENKTLAEFDQKVENVLESNPDVTEDELLDIVEKYKVEPEVAVLILKDRYEGVKTNKPKMPASKRGTGENMPKIPYDSKKDRGKPFWRLGREALASFREKGLL